MRTVFESASTSYRRRIAWSDPVLADLVADSSAKYDPTESESILFGEGFAAVTDIQTGPRGNLFLVSVSNGAVYEIQRRRHGR